MRGTLFAIISFFLFHTLPADAASVQTSFGEREGIVVARLFEHILITIITPEKRVFQYSVADVDSVSATETVLIGVNTFLREQPSNSAAPIVALTRGLQVTILASPHESGWIRVQVWNGHEGWILNDLLTNKVVFTPEEKQQALQDRNTIRTSTEHPGDLE